jgi:hypothetical protein
MRFDINAFFGHWPYWPLPHTGIEDTLRLMDRHAVDRAAVTSLRGLHGDWKEANAETLAAATAHADRFVPVACISPMKKGSADALRSLAREGFRAVRLYPQLLQGYTLQSPWADEIASAAAEFGMPVITPTRPMMNFRFPAVPVEAVAALAHRNPNTMFILSGPNYLSEFRAAIEAMHRCFNTYIEISCMQGFHATARMAAAVGHERVLFGTGMPLHYPACNVAKLEHSGLSHEALEAISSGNALRILQV